MRQKCAIFLLLEEKRLAKYHKPLNYLVVLGGVFTHTLYEVDASEEHGGPEVTTAVRGSPAAPLRADSVAGKQAITLRRLDIDP